MKIRRVRQRTVFFLIASIFVLTTSFVAGRALSDETRDVKVLASVVVTSEENFWQAAGNIAAEMKFRETIQGLRTLADTNVEILKELAPAKPAGLIVATNGNDVFAFVFLPILDPSSFYEENIALLNAQLSEKGLQKVFDDVFVDGSNLFFCMAKYRELIPTQTLDQYVQLPKNDDETINVASINVNVENIPSEFIEASMSGVRQQLGQKVSETDFSAEKVNQQLDYYSNILDSLKTIKYDLLVDESKNLIQNVSVECKNGSLLAQQLTKNSEIQTRWNILAETSNAAFMCVKAGTIVESVKEDQLNELQNVVHEEALDQLKELLDDPEDLNAAKDIVGLLESSLVEYLKEGKYDYGCVVSCDPTIVSIASSMPQTQYLKKALVRLCEQLKKNKTNFDAYVKLDDETIGKFAISKLDVPVQDLGDPNIPIFKEKSLVVRLAMSNDAVILLLGLDAKDVDKELARIVNNSSELSTIPKESYIQIAPIANLLSQAFSDLDAVRPVARKTLERMANAEGAKFVVESEIDKTTYRLSLKITKEIFQMAGDVVRINIAGDKAGDAGEDLDDLFDDESEE